MNTMIYRGCTAEIVYSSEDECLVGHLIGIRDIVGFHGGSVTEIRVAFEESVDFYLDIGSTAGSESAVER